MNDIELDRLLDTWSAPAPPPSLREGLRARFPRVEHRRFAYPLRWALAIGVISATLVIGMERSRESQLGYQVVRVVNRLYENFMEGLEAWRATLLVAQIRQSEPKVYVDGQLVAPLEYGHAASMNVNVPGEGLYSIITYPMPGHRADGGLTGWVEAGNVRGNVIEFQAGGKQVRIECNQPIVDSDRPVFVLHRQ
jgi:hypothetical protein